MSANAVRVRLVQMDVRPGHPEANVERMLREIEAARTERVDVVVFPAMAVPGCFVGDAWESEAFLRECERCAWEIAAASRGLTVVFGSVGVDWKRRGEDGRVRKYNALYVARDRSFCRPEEGPYDFVPDRPGSHERVFEERRHLWDLRQLALETGQKIKGKVDIVEAGGLRLGFAVCDEAGDAPSAPAPLKTLRRQGVHLWLNLSASPYVFNQNPRRQRSLREHVRQRTCPLLYVNCVGVQDTGKTVFVFDGGSCVYDPGGSLLASAPLFQEAALTLDLALGPSSGQSSETPSPNEDIGTIGEAILYGTRSFMERCGVERVVVGISGGVDSSVVAALYRRLLPPDRLLLVNLPGPYTSETTRRLARSLAEALGSLYIEVPICESLALTRRQLDGRRVTSLDGRIGWDLRLTEAVLENVQARDRSGRVLAAIAAAFGGVFTCNANKSEVTVGYTTLYGDLSGYLANVGDLWKTEVYELARHLNDRVYGRETIPQGTLTVTPSAELSPAQNVDAGKGDPLWYPYHDCLFRAWVERRTPADPEDLLAWYAADTLEREIGYEGKVSELFPTAVDFVADLERWWNLYQGLAVAKRLQAPPILAVTRRAFGSDLREVQMGPRYTARYRALRRRLLGGAEASEGGHLGTVNVS